MGRHAGHIALQTGIAVGATSILVPEVPFDVDRDIVDRMQRNKTTGKKHFIIVVAEGVGHVEELAKEIQQKTGIESRATVLGHVQRGGSPSVRDRVVASEMGHYAVELLKSGKGNRVVAMQNNKIVDFDITDALAMKKKMCIRDRPAAVWASVFSQGDCASDRERFGGGPCSGFIGAGSGRYSRKNCSAFPPRRWRRYFYRFGI